jgi:cell division septation protein DedD
LAQDDYYYEIQLTNKQLVFYFMAGAAGLVLSFLAGVMVGRGLENGAAAAGVDQARAVAEEKVVTEQTPTPSPTDFSYPQRLESEKQPEGLEKSAAVPAAAPGTLPARPVTTRPAAAAATPAPTPVATPTPAKAVPTPAKPLPTPAHAAPAAATHAATAGLPKPIGSTASVKGFAVQVGAFKDKAGADTVVKSLKDRSLPAFTVAPAAPGGGLFTVRVGVYRDRADAEAVVERLRDDKFKPYIIKQQ